jgi:hypothetical protein
MLSFEALASTVIVFTLLTTAGVVNPMALPVVSLMLPLARPARLK